MEKSQQDTVTTATTVWMPLTRGVVLIIFGILMFALGRGTTLVAAIQFFGAYWLISGIIDIFNGVIGQTENRSRLWMIVGGIVSIVAGFIVMSNPVISGLIASRYLVLFMGIGAIVAGVAHIFSGGGQGWSVGGMILGVLYAVFGIAVVFNPLITTAVVVAVLPFWALISGVSSVMVAMMGPMLRSQAQG